MIRRALVGLFLLATLACVAGCGTPNLDGLPVAITPNVVRVAVGDVTTIQVQLTKPRDEAGTIKFVIDDRTKLAPASQKGEISVEKGQDTVYFDLQGLDPGQTVIKAQIEGFNPVSAVVIISEN